MISPLWITIKEYQTEMQEPLPITSDAACMQASCLEPQGQTNGNYTSPVRLSTSCLSRIADDPCIDPLPCRTGLYFGR